MKFLPVIALFALWGCAANKPAAEQANAGGDDPKCKEFMKFIPTAKNPPTDYIIGLNGDSCPCNETITCDEKTYCSAYICPEGVVSIFR